MGTTGADAGNSGQHNPAHPHYGGDNDHRDFLGARLYRITPTCVGTTMVGIELLRGRSRFTPTTVGTTDLDDQAERAVKARFTPTSVGTTWSNNLRRRHLPGSPPRLWGQQQTPCRPVELHVGSPPRMWGQRRTYVPNIQLSTGHPHACRDNGQLGVNSAHDYGSPPHGGDNRVGHSLAAPADRRITPTPVGTTTW